MRIDWWTLGLQTINVLVLVWLLRRFLFQPLKAMIEARRAAAARLLDQAEGMRAKAQEELAALEARRGGFEVEERAILAAAHAAAASDRQALLDQAREEVARLQTEVRARLAQEGETQRRTLESQAGELAVMMARRLLDLLPPAMVTAALLDAVVNEVGQLPEGTRRSLASAGPVTVATATPMTAETQAAWRERLDALLGADVQIGFEHDPALLAGVEIRGPHTLLRRNWRADLERLARSLSLAPQAQDVRQLA
jgi:F-type H+-transporting ATPase subunit b